MNNSQAERRRFKRIFFPGENNIQARFSFLGNCDLIMNTMVLDLSETGLRLMLPKKESNGIRTGDILLLREITGHPHLHFMRNIKSEIRWVLNHEFLDHLGFGCEFVNLPPLLKNQLRNSLKNGQIIG